MDKDGYKKARYRGIPCLFNEDTYDLAATNWFYDIILDVFVWFDAVFVGEFRIEILPEDEQ